MIEVKDLMIGNLVITDDKIAEVVSIWKKDIKSKYTDSPLAVAYYSDEFKGIVSKSVEEKDINPIPLCKELLIDYGFKEEYDKILKYTEYKIDLGDFHITADNFCSNSRDKEWCIHIDNICYSTVGGGDINYLHELQNLIKIICGIELIRKEEEEDEV